MRINTLLAFGSVAALVAAGGAYMEMRSPSVRVMPSASVDMGHRPSAQSLMQSAVQTAPPAIRQFYEQRGFAPAWTDDDGVLPAGQAALKLLQQAPAQGLPAAYAVPAPPVKADAQARIAFDMALTEAMLKFSRDLRLGQTDPAAVYGPQAVSLPARHFDPAPAIANFSANGDAAAYLASLEPSAPDYSQLKLALAHYRAIAASGDWPQVNGKDTAALGARLRREGYQGANAQDPVQIRRALMAYQERSGLEPSGKLDAATRQMLNVPAAQRVIQILANMERWRWMPQQFEPRYIMVNIAGASLNLMENGAPAISSRVVVGQPDKQTPILQTSAVAVTINPVWHVPASIIKNELMDKIAEDGGYLDRKNMTIKDGRIEQAPGPDNALGVVKFEMPNRLDIYLHDTPSKSAFRARNRALSHGCVRVEEIRSLAARALGVEPDALEEWIAGGETLHRALPSPIPVYIGYWTAIPGGDGTVGFRGDVYGRDETLIKALQEKSSPRQT